MKLKYDVTIPKQTYKRPISNGCNNLIKNFAKSKSKTAEVFYQGSYKNANSGRAVFREAIVKLGLGDEIRCLVRGKRLFLEKKESNEDGSIDVDVQEEVLDDPVYLTGDDIDLADLLKGVMDDEY